MCMDKKLHEHMEYMERRLAGLEKIDSNELKQASSQHKISQLRRYHTEMTRHFQHERMVRLIVTLFFAMLWIASLCGLASMFSYEPGLSDYMLSWLLGLLSSIILVTDIFYIRHYYVLENGTQRLYDFSVRLHGLCAGK